MTLYKLYAKTKSRGEHKDELLHLIWLFLTQSLLQLHWLLHVLNLQKHLKEMPWRCPHLVGLKTGIGPHKCMNTNTQTHTHRSSGWTIYTLFPQGVLNWIFLFLFIYLHVKLLPVFWVCIVPEWEKVSGEVKGPSAVQFAC